MRGLTVGDRIALVDDDVYEREKGHRWKLDRSGYPYRTIRGVKRWNYLHHAVLGGRAPGLVADHIDGNPLNAQRSNLRWADASQNQANRRRICGKVSLKGVCVHTQTGRFMAQIKCRGKNHYLGLFDDPMDAARAYANAARLHFGAFAFASVEPTAVAPADEARAA